MTELITRTQLAAELNIDLTTLCGRILGKHGNWANFPAPTMKIGRVVYYNKTDVFEFIKTKESEATQTRLTNKIRANERAAVRSKNVAKKLKAERRLAKIISAEKGAARSPHRLISLDMKNKNDSLSDLKRARSNPVIEYSGIALLSINFHNRVAVAKRAIVINALKCLNER
ncbi:hypothetical protein [Methylobacter sp. S3L5C]|uniref:hypothetical protein n=1 Tax=Methylobacter sp. S3L5C TaxID=2839024 RepID=UPI001FADE382|nr:hypothetical protein [Methylobacter sp. S3L5C]UOA08356.1 hypothetical protein KKZ03_19470 [Methylobacter sp. S3L5C]